jgi:hypothetical protein
VDGFVGRSEELAALAADELKFAVGARETVTDGAADVLVITATDIFAP